MLSIKEKQDFAENAIKKIQALTIKENDLLEKRVEPKVEGNYEARKEIHKEIESLKTVILALMEWLWIK